MNGPNQADASFFIGLVLGIALGAAAALILMPHSEGPDAAQLAGQAAEAQKQLEDRKANIKADVAELRGKMPETGEAPASS